MAHADLLARIVVNPAIFGGKPIIRGHRLAVEHVLDMLAAGDDIDTIVEGYAWMEREDVLACIEASPGQLRMRFPDATSSGDDDGA
jgi:uncharacterized protein (DUF433 family)